MISSLPDAAVACGACSLQAGGWAGEWEGQFTLTVPAPCRVLLALTAHASEALRQALGDHRPATC